MDAPEDTGISFAAAIASSQKKQSQV